MNTSFFNEFLALAERGSFSVAARELEISQATLSRHIMQMEEEYGAPLFRRTTQKISITPYGEALLAYARQVVEGERQFRQTVARIRLKAASRLAIGTVDFPSFYGITSLLADFKKAHPDVMLDVRVGSTDTLLKMLEVGLVDIAFVRNITDLSDRCVACLYQEDRIHAVVPADHPLAGRRTVQQADFERDTFYFRFPKGSLMDQFYTRLFCCEGFEPRRSANHGNWEDSIINGGNDVSLAASGLSNTLNGNLHVKVLELDPPIHCDIYVARSKGFDPSDIAREFFAFARDQAEG